METLNVSLPGSLKKYVQERVSTGGYGNTSEYVRDLIRSEQKQRAKAELEALIMAFHQANQQSGWQTQVTQGRNHMGIAVPKRLTEQ